MKVDSRQKSCYWVAAVAGAGAVFRIWLASPGMLFFSFQVRDLERAAEVARGHLLLWGPDMTGGGHLPGGLYYWLLSMPLYFGLGWHGCWLLVCGFWIATAMGGTFLLAWAFGVLPALLAGFYAFLPLAILQNFLNVSATPPFIALALAGICAGFAAEAPRARARGWALACFAVGCGVQLHFSVGILFAAALSLQLFAPVLRLPRLPARSFLTGLAWLVAPLAPYFLHVALGVGAASPADSGSASDALPSLFYLARSFWRPGLFWEIIQKVFLLCPLTLLTASLACLRPTDTPGQPSAVRRILLVCTAISFVPASYYLMRPNGLRYVMPFEAGLLALFASTAMAALSGKSRAATFTLGNIAVAAVAAFGVRKAVDPAAIPFALGLLVTIPFFLWAARESLGTKAAAFGSAALLLGMPSLLRWPNSVSLPIMTVADMTALAERVFSQTGWSYAEARSRIFYIDKQMELSPKFIYDEVAARPPSVSRAGQAPDGYLATTAHVDLEFNSHPTVASFGRWLERQPLQRDLRAGLRDGSIVLGEPYYESPLVLVPFTVRDPRRIPARFGNAGYSYEASPGEELMRFPSPRGVRFLGAEEVLFYWKECPMPWCTTAAKIRFRIVRGSLEAAVSIQGSPLAQSSEWTGPGWTQAWIAPYLEAHCGSGVVRAPLFESVGINPLHAVEVGGMRQAYNSFLAPIERTLLLPCRGGLQALALGRESTLLYAIDGIHKLTPAPQSIKIEGMPLQR